MSNFIFIDRIMPGVYSLLHTVYSCNDLVINTWDNFHYQKFKNVRIGVSLVCFTMKIITDTYYDDQRSLIILNVSF